MEREGGNKPIEIPANIPCRTADGNVDSTPHRFRHRHLCAAGSMRGVTQEWTRHYRNDSEARAAGLVVSAVAVPVVAVATVRATSSVLVGDGWW